MHMFKLPPTEKSDIYNIIIVFISNVRLPFSFFSMLRLLKICLLAFAAVFAVPVQAKEEGKAGADVVEAFRQAAEGRPLRYVAIGGSITQAGKGWIGEWLTKQFPESNVTAINSGMSATGSGLGIFRIERDIIDHQPDLVAIEYCVNDGSRSDEEAIRTVESMVVRLRQLPNPPAIFFITAAAKGGVKFQRHRAVAEHYGIFEVDLQAAVDADLAKRNLPWETYFGDAVHCNEAGNAFYTETISRALAPLVKQARNSLTEKYTPTPLPKPLSTQPLILDGSMAVLSSLDVPGWSIESSLPFWWNRFFNGVLSSSEPGSVLVYPFRGTTIGLFYALNVEYGAFMASVDGGDPVFVSCNHRGGYDYKVFAQDLEPGNHLLTIVIPSLPNQPDAKPRPAKLGFALTAGSGLVKGNPPLVKQGRITADYLRSWQFTAIAPSAWKFSTFYPVSEASATDAKGDLEKAFPAEAADADRSDWKNLQDDNGRLDFRKALEVRTPGTIYGITQIERDEAGTAFLGLSVDYFAKVWVNGELVSTLSGGHSANAPQLIPITLQKGSNTVLVKIGAGSAGHNFSAQLIVPK